MSPLPLTGALSPLAAQQGVDLTSLALAEMEFERKLQEVRDWLKSTRATPCEFLEEESGEDNDNG